MQRWIVITVIFFMLGISSVAAQNTSFPDTETLSDNVDSLIADSIRKAFILNHRPVSDVELNGIRLVQVDGFYGRYVTAYVQGSPYYKLSAPVNRQFISKRSLPHLEWMFYGFSVMFLFLGLINAYFSNYLKKLFRVFANQGFVYRQTKDQMIQAPFAAFLLNILFLLSGTLFIYFGLGGNNLFTGVDRWRLMLLVFSFLVVVYAFKFLFLQFLGWVFNQEETLENYVFIVFLNNKISGITMLLASFFMAFSESEIGSLVFRSSLYLLAALMLIRFVRGFQVFSKQARLGFFSFVLAIISLELLPTAVMVKFISTGIQLVIGDLL